MMESDAAIFFQFKSCFKKHMLHFIINVNYIIWDNANYVK